MNDKLQIVSAHLVAANTYNKLCLLYSNVIMLSNNMQMSVCWNRFVVPYSIQMDYIPECRPYGFRTFMKFIESGVISVIVYFLNNLDIIICKINK